jgi:hypothetical protein
MYDLEKEMNEYINMYDFFFFEQQKNVFHIYDLTNMNFTLGYLTQMLESSVILQNATN